MPRGSSASRWGAPAIVTAAALLGLVASCKDLPTVTAGACGNSVVEAPEDCDTFAPFANAVCRAKGTAGQCRLDCRPRTDGTRPTCPPGWGCDLEGLCRAPTGQFEPPITHKVGGAVSLKAGDFDGDGRTDILSRGQLDAVGRSKMRFHYFDQRAGLADTRLFPKLGASPLIVDLTGDGRSDVFFTEPRIGLLNGRADRAWIPEAFGSYRFADTEVRFFGVYHESVEHITPIVAMGTLNQVTGFFALDPDTGQLRVKSVLPGPVEQLMGNPATGDVIADLASSPCRELLFAMRGAVQLNVIDLCGRATAPRREAAVGEPIWRDAAVETTVALVPPAPIDAAPQLTDMNGDGHVDVIVGAGGRLYVGYGDGKRLADATPFALAAANADELLPINPELPMPLAAGDFSGDGHPDFVFPNFLLISSPGVHPSFPTLPAYALRHTNFSVVWTDALIADLNGNGKLDVIAASRAHNDIDFFNGGGVPYVTRFSLPTSAPVHHLTIEDFDGDLVNDVAWVQKGATATDRDSLNIAFGSAAGPPLPPAAVATLGRADQLAAIRSEGIGSLAIASLDQVAARKFGVLTFMLGSGDRIPFAPYELTNYTVTGSLQGWAPIALTTGAFIAPGQHDVLALVTSDFQKDWQFWVVPELAAARNAPVILAPGLDPRLQPASGSNDADLRFFAAAASGDLDGDGRDESVWAVPADAGARCGVVVVGKVAAAPETFTVAPTLFLDEPCAAAEIATADADGDGRPDLVLLTGDADFKGRKLLVIWNDGAGHFAPGAVSPVSAPGHLPRGFVTLAAVSDRRFSFVYITDTAAVAVSASEVPRVFAPPRDLTAVESGTGIAAGDVDGDGLVDLVLAAGGNLGVMKAQTRP